MADEDLARAREIPETSLWRPELAVPGEPPSAEEPTTALAVAGVGHKR